MTFLADQSSVAGAVWRPALRRRHPGVRRALDYAARADGGHAIDATRFRIAGSATQRPGEERVFWKLPEARRLHRSQARASRVNFTESPRFLTIISSVRRRGSSFADKSLELRCYAIASLFRTAPRFVFLINLSGDATTSLRLRVGVRSCSETCRTNQGRERR